MASGEMDSRKNEAVTVQPLGVLGVELHDLVEKNVGNGCHTPILSLLAILLWSSLTVPVARFFGFCVELRTGLLRFLSERGAEGDRGGNVHRGTGVARVGMEGRIGLKGQNGKQLIVWLCWKAS